MEERPRRRSQDLECQDLGDEIMILDRRTDRVHVLNPTMAAIWKLTDGERSESEIAEEFSEVFDCSDAEDPRDVTSSALKRLAELDLVVTPPALEEG